MAYAFVQAKFANPGTGSGPTFDTNVTAGNSIVVDVAYPGTQATTGVTDTLGNTYTLAKAQAGGSTRHAEAWTTHNILGGTNTVKIAFTGGGTIDVVAREYSGVVSTDQVAGASVDSTANPSSGNTPATTSANELVCGMVWTSSTTPAAGSGFTARNGALGNNYFYRAEDKRVTATGAQAATFTATAQEWIALCVTCAESGGATSPFLSSRRVTGHAVTRASFY